MSICVEVSQEAGKAISNVYSAGNWVSSITEKLEPCSNDLMTPSLIMDPRTIADLRSQNIITSCLRYHFPSVQLVGEEDEKECEEFSKKDTDYQMRPVELYSDHFLSSHEVGFPKYSRSIDSNDLIIWIDPLDGTGEFIRKRFDSVTVLIGISMQGKPIGGVIHHPMSQKTIWGVIDQGAFGIRRFNQNLTARKKILTSRLHFSDSMLKVIDFVKPSEVEKCGGAGSKILKILNGDAEAYIHADIGTKKWDSCAGDAILRSAGGMMTDIYGSDIDYSSSSSAHNRTGLLATFGMGHQDFVIKRSVLSL